MPGPNLEVFRFTFYLFFPVYVMFKVGDPQWYQDHVIPYKELIWPTKHEHPPPRNQADLQAELARYRAERAARKAALGEAGAAPAAPGYGHEQERAVDAAAASSPSTGSVGVGASRWAWPSASASSSVGVTPSEGSGIDTGSGPGPRRADERLV